LQFIPLGAEQSWQGDFLSLARNFSWMNYAGEKTAKGSKGRIENRSHHHHHHLVMNEWNLG
jgi:hypothetical protein